MSSDDFSALALSVKVALTAVIVGLPLAFGTAYLLARGRFVGRSILDALVHLPLVVPPVATGFLLLLLFGQQGLIGRGLAEFGIVFAFNWTGAALAAGIMAFPLMVRPIRLAIEAIDPEIEDVGKILGADFWSRLWRVTLPLSGSGLIGGAVLGFAKALGEFGATITFVAAIPNETLTLPTAIYQAAQVPGGEGHALWLCGLAAALSTLAVIVSNRLAPRSPTR